MADEADKCLRKLTLNEVDAASIAALGGFSHTTSSGHVHEPNELPVADAYEGTERRLVSAATSVLFARMAREGSDDAMSPNEHEQSRRESEVKQAAMQWLVSMRSSGASTAECPSPQPANEEELAFPDDMQDDMQDDTLGV